MLDSTGPGALGRTAEKVLDFRMQRAYETNWGWAAMAVSVKKYFSPYEPLTQCMVVCNAFMESSCCSKGSTPQCNRTHDMGKALKQLNVLNMTSNGKPDFAQVEKQINDGRPLVLEIMVDVATKEGTAKREKLQLALYGYEIVDTANPSIIVQGSHKEDDMIKLPFNGFPGNYRAGSTWETTYLCSGR